MPPNDVLGLNNSSSLPDVTGSSYEDDATADRAAAAQAKHENASLGFLAAGLAMLGHRRGESAGEAIGRGGLVGLNAYEQGENRYTQGALAQHKERDLNRYRDAELGISRQKLTNDTNRTNIYQEGMREHEKHDAAQEKTAEEGKDIEYGKLQEDQKKTGIAAQNEGINAYKATLDAKRVDIEGTRLQQDFAPIGTDVVKQFRGSNVEKVIPLLPPDVVAHMPKKDALAYARSVTTSYAQKSKDPSLNINYQALKDGVHRIVTDPKTGATVSDTFIGQKLTTGKGGTDTLAAEANAIASGADPSTAGAPGTTAAPEAAPAAAPLPSGAPPKNLWGHTVKIGGRTIKIDENGKVVE